VKEVEKMKFFSLNQSAPYTSMPHREHAIILKLACGLAVLLGLHPKAVASDEMVFFSFFRKNGEAGVYLGASEDGLNFTPLNNDQPVMKPAPWAGQNLTRDPSIVFHDGTFHMVWTSSWTGNCFGYAESKDLMNWSDPVRVQPFPATMPQPRNTWAPEITFDPVQKNFMIVWSSEDKLYVTRTADGKTFTDALPFIEQSFGCIDGMLVHDGTVSAKRWVMIYKNEDPEEKGGKNLHVATAPSDFSKPWSLEPAPIIGPGTKVGAESMVEGPSLLKQGDEWLLYWDSPSVGVYGMASSRDLKTWTNRTADLKLPDHPRHGTVFRAPRSAAATLLKTQGNVSK
jgi:predicted GH43/DUF377 family glycosyl hydrolase